MKAFAGCLPVEFTQRVVDFCCSGDQIGKKPDARGYVFLEDPEGSGRVRTRNMNSPTRGFGNEDGPLNFSEKQRRRCIYLQARVDPKSLILRGPQNGVVTVSTMESRKVAAMERLFYLSHQVYHSKVLRSVLTRILPVAAGPSLVAFVLGMPQLEANGLRWYLTRGSLGPGQYYSQILLYMFFNIPWYPLILLHLLLSGLLFIVSRRTHPKLAWLSFFPGGNILVVVKIAGKPLWWILILLIPLSWPTMFIPLSNWESPIASVIERASLLLPLPFLL